MGCEDVYKTSIKLGYVSRGDELDVSVLISHLSEFRLTKGFVVEEYDGEKWNDYCNHTDYKTKLDVH